MSRVLSLAEAVESAVRDGDTVALEGFTHLIPHAAGHEIIRQGRKRLTLVRMTPDLIYDQLIKRPGVMFDLAKFSWIGKAADDTRALMVSKTSGFKNIDDILHKDAGCTSELDYTEQSSWLLFLKYLLLL